MFSSRRKEINLGRQAGIRRELNHDFGNSKTRSCR